MQKRAPRSSFPGSGLAPAPPSPPADLPQQLCRRALLRGTFTLRNGTVSDRYFDKYRVTTDPQLLAAVTSALDALRSRHAGAATVIVAPALGAVPLATALSLASGLPFVIVRDTVKEHGPSHAIEGRVTPGSIAVLVEDVVTSGGAAVAAYEAATAAGLTVMASLCVLDRDGGGREALAELGAPLTSLISVKDLDAAFDAGIGEVVSD